MGCGDCIERDFGEESAKPAVAEATSRAFDGVGAEIGRFRGSGGGSPWCAAGFSSSVDACFVKGDFKPGGECAHKSEVGVCFFAAKTVV